MQLRSFLVLYFVLCGFVVLAQQKPFLSEIKKMMDAKEFERALADLHLLENRIPQNDSQYGTLLNYLAVCHSANFDEEEAIFYFEKAVDYFKKSRRLMNSDGTTLYYDYGEFYFRFNSFKKAIEKFDTFLLLQQSSDEIDTSRVYAAHSMCSYAYRRIGDFDKALDHLNRSEKLHLKFGEKETRYAALHYYFGGVYYEMSEYQKAVDHFAICIKIWEQEPEKYQGRLQSSYSAAADMYWKLNNRDMALKMYDKEAGVKFEKAGTHDEEIDDETLQLKQWRKGGDYETLLNYFNKALEFRKSQYGEAHPVVAGCNNYIGGALNSLGKTKEALQTYHHSVCLLVPGFSDSSVFSIPDPEQHNYSDLYLLEAMEEKARIFLYLASKENNARYLKVAYEHLNYSLKLIDKIRTDNKNEISKMFWTDRSFPVFELSIECCIKLHERTNDQKYLQKAFMISEQSKAFLILEAVRETEIRQFANVPTSVIENERDFELKINDYNQKIFYEGQKCGEVSNQKIDLWNDKVYALKSEYDVLLSEIRLKYPKYYALKHDQLQFNYLSLTNTILSESVIMVEFFYGTDNLYVFYVTNNDIAVRSIRIDSTLNSNINTVRKFCSDIVHYQQDPSNLKSLFIKSSSELYELFFPELRDWDFEKFDEMIIVPDGQLHYLPFEVLLTEQEIDVQTSYSLLPYLLKKSTVSYANSAHVLMTVDAKDERSYSSDVIAFAPDYIDKRNLVGLKHSMEEVGEVASIFNSQVFVGSHATIHNFKRMIRHSKIIHLAMHSSMEDEQPLYSKFLFSEDGNNGAELHAYDLYGLDINADLVVLSACNTGNGNLIRGEGVLSLSRAFLYANVPSIVMSLWTVDDQSTSALIRNFYIALKEGQSKADALTQAKITYLENADPADAHPFYWAGFKLVGKNSPLIRDPLSPATLILYVIFAFTILIIGIAFLEQKFTRIHL